LESQTRKQSLVNQNINTLLKLEPVSEITKGSLSMPCQFYSLAVQGYILKGVTLISL
jgi:hypothetical protein